MDIVPTALHAADGSAPTDDTGEFDGTSILDLLSDGTDLPERDLYWELDGQTAIRRGNSKLVIDGVLRERNAPQTHIHLSDLSTDTSESTNLADQMPDLASELETAALNWRAGIQNRWDRDYADLGHGIVTYADFPVG